MNEIFRLLGKLLEYNLNDAELALISAFILTEPDREGLDESDRMSVQNMHNAVAQALRLQVMHNHDDKPDLYEALMSDYAHLRDVGRCVLVSFAWFKTQSSCMTLPELFSEIYDIPIHDE